MELGMSYPTLDVDAKFSSIQRQSYHPIETLASCIHPFTERERAHALFSVPKCPIVRICISRSWKSPPAQQHPSVHQVKWLIDRGIPPLRADRIIFTAGSPTVMDSND